jgi:hypothetical protein
MISRGVDVSPIVEFVILASSGVMSAVVADRVIHKFRGRTEKIEINHRRIDLDDEGQVRRIVEDEIHMDRIVRRPPRRAGTAGQGLPATITQPPRRSEAVARSESQHKKGDLFNRPTGR